MRTKPVRSRTGGGGRETEEGEAWEEGNIENALSSHASPSSVFSGYSVRKLFTGFINAASTDWKLTVNSATSSAIPPTRANTHQPMLTW